VLLSAACLSVMTVWVSAEAVVITPGFIPLNLA